MSTRRRRTPGNDSTFLGATDTGRSIWQSGYWLVLALLTVSYVLCAIQTSPNPSLIALLFQLVTVAATLWVAQVKPSIRRLGWAILTAVGLAVVIVQLGGVEGRLLGVILSTASMLAYLVAPVAIIAHQARKMRVDGQTFLAAISAYIMVGMFFTFAYSLAALSTAQPLFGEGDEDTLTSRLFFSFTTLTTTGYGNLVPVGALAQSVAIMEAIAGQLFLVVVVARVVSGWQPQRR
ncbi:ion channel [Mycetocola sp. 2940]|uniref:ion channel n=1 Tax=Mycetocola sp. 2940 TaxID=3156452 RepID=UPI00339375B6